MSKIESSLRDIILFSYPLFPKNKLDDMIERCLSKMDMPKESSISCWGIRYCRDMKIIIEEAHKFLKGLK